jgi:hypothetical protein
MSYLRIVSLEDEDIDYSFNNVAKSVFLQTNANWQWTIEEKLLKRLTRSNLKRKIRADKRITVRNLSINAVELDLSKNWGIVFLRPGFSIARNFIQVIEEQQLKESFDFLYTDVQLINRENGNDGIWRRPQNCTERLLHHNYVSGALVVQKSVIENVIAHGDIPLDEIEAKAICEVIAEEGTFQHIADPIVQVRREIVAEQMHAGSQHWLEETSKVAVKKQHGFVSAQGPTGNWVMRRLPKEKVSISIVIPTRGDKKIIWGIETDLIENVVRSLFQRTDNEEFEVIVVHDVNKAFDEHIDSLAHYGDRVKLVPYEKPFNFSDKCNVGAVHSSAQVVVFLNDDIEVIDPWWLDHLVGYLESGDVGAVGPVLLLDNGMIQTAGHVNQPLPANYYAGRPLGVRDFPEPLDIPCEVSGLTAACLALRREVFDEVGGFCEALPNNFNDVDLCLKIQQSGRSLIWTPLARLYHFESVTRVGAVTQGEIQFIQDRWGRTFEPDRCRSRIE